MNIDRFLETSALIAWLIFGLLITTSFILNWQRYGFGGAVRRLFSIINLLGLIPPMVLLIVSMSLVFIEPQQVGVVVSFFAPRGYREQPLESGRHWIIPISEYVVIYPISRQTYTMSGNPTEGGKQGNDAIRARTSDGQEVQIDVSVIFALDAERIVQLHITWQDRYIDDLVRPILRGRVRSEVSQFKVEEVNSAKRQELERTLTTELQTTLDENGIILDQLLLRNITFSDEYAFAIEEKQIALEKQTQSQYEAQAIRNLAEGRADEIRRIAEANAEAVQIEAQAQATALELIRAALAGDEQLLIYRYIDKIAPNVRVMLLPSENPLVISLADLNAMGTGEESDSALDNLFPNTTPTPTETPTPIPTPQVP